MPLVSGTKLGPYEVVGPLGAGGMGEVYRARDTRLDRTVAIKILPAQFSSDLVRKQRFEREAKTISSLNHPHICVLHDIGSQDGINYLVMECVEGETLARRLENGPLPLEQVLKYGMQIADALDKAHRSGMVHRDLKPGNIMLTSTGAKLLDFGLAKPVAALTSVATLTAAVTQSSPMTEHGAIVGTFQYMSPEQVEGKELDGRSDIFSLGAVLYEMLTGQRAFQGKSRLSVASAILEKEPAPINEVKPLTPANLDHAIRRCLAKDPEERWQTARDLTLELKWISEAGSQAGLAALATTQDGRTKMWVRVSWAVAAIATLLAIAFGYSDIRKAPDDAISVRAFIPAPDKTQFAPTGIDGGPVTISPNGRLMVFAARDESGKQLLWIRALDSASAQPLSGTDGGAFPFWSPDSRYVAFFAAGALKKVEASGGPVQNLCEAAEGRGGSWNRDGLIIFAPSIRTPLSQVSDAGGTPVSITKFNSTQKTFERADIVRIGASHRWPYFLPDGRHYLFFARGAPDGIYVGTVGSDETKFLLQSNSNAAYSPTGHLLWWRDGTLVAQPFDANRLVLSGNASPVADHILYLTAQSFGAFSISQNGILVFQGGAQDGRQPTFGANQLSWMDRSGKQVGTVGEPDFIFNPRISPDGKSIAAEIGDYQGLRSDIWIFELSRGVRTRFTLSQSASYPVWAPDGSRIVFGSVSKGQFNLLAKSSSGASGEEILLDNPGGKLPWSWSADGRYIAYTTREANPATDKFDIWILPLFGEKKPFPFVQSDYYKGAPMFSPDGRWIAYHSNESGTPEVYVAAFPGPGRRFQASAGGGVFPRWRPDGKELFYLTQGSQLMSVEVASRGGSLELQKPQPLFRNSAFAARIASGGRLGLGVQPFDVARDGRFIITSSSDVTPSPITVVTNWYAALKKK